MLGDGGLHPEGSGGYRARMMMLMAATWACEPAVCVEEARVARAELRLAESAELFQTACDGGDPEGCAGDYGTDYEATMECRSRLFLPKADEITTKASQIFSAFESEVLSVASKSFSRIGLLNNGTATTKAKTKR